MLGQDFYHSLTRKYVIIFGNVFNDISVARFDKNGRYVQNIPVPIKYGPTSRYYAELLNPPEEQRVSLKLPMISFYDSQLTYDSDRQIPNIHINVANGDMELSKSINKYFVPTPMKITMDMTIMSKNVEDAAQIVEQIVPFFTPSIQVKANLIEGLEPFDIQINLTGLSKEHAYEEVTRQFVQWTLTFEVWAWFFGPKKNQGVIKQSIVSFINDYTSKKMATVTTQPGLTEDGKPTTDINESIDYRLIKETDDYGYIEDIKEFIIEGD